MKRAREDPFWNNVKRIHSMCPSMRTPKKPPYWTSWQGKSQTSPIPEHPWEANLDPLEEYTTNRNARHFLSAVEQVIASTS